MKKLISEYFPDYEKAIYEVKIGSNLVQLILYANPDMLTNYLKNSEEMNCKYFKFFSNLSLFNLETFDLPRLVNKVFKDGIKYTQIEVARL